MADALLHAANEVLSNLTAGIPLFLNRVIICLKALILSIFFADYKC
ncbi:uncharacterized protein METZ01_LOCUS244008 [marine metagenome]|uniref:Uncharacterized protein n=1 Tax=marine metagenome TaxID=408172 RepID=A0A382HUT9_9ZZZZ